MELGTLGNCCPRDLYLSRPSMRIQKYFFVPESSNRTLTVSPEGEDIGSEIILGQINKPILAR
jgi:hypothetical protein